MALAAEVFKLPLVCNIPFFALARVTLFEISTVSMSTASVPVRSTFVDELDANSSRSSHLIRTAVNVVSWTFASEGLLVVVADGRRITVVFS